MNEPATEALELQAILDTMADGVLFIDHRHRIRRWNQAMERLTGYRAGEVLGQHCTMLRDENACGAGMGRVEDRLSEQGRFSKVETLIRRKDGARVPLLVSACAMTGDDGEDLGAVITFSDISEVRRLEHENRRLRAAVDHPAAEHLIGESHAMAEVFDLAGLAAASDETVLVLGETGTGKELVARAIHRMSQREDGPMVTVNCSALSEPLLESELFGHARGAFTGAVRDHTGRFEAAAGGTVFLDEVGELTPLVQVKLLRVLQEHTIERVGEAVPRHVDVRIIAATHRDLHERVRAGQFRQDLFYRLNVFPIRVPPLRERKADIEPLLQHFIARQRNRTGKPITGCTTDALRALMDHNWPGNVRELENAVAHAFVTCPGNLIDIGELPRDLRPGGSWHVRDSANSVPPAGTPSRPRTALTQEEIARALRESAGNKAEAARRLGIDRTTLWRRMKALHMPLQIP